ncbi:MAG: biopolymer transporter ExbD [Burkholderiales bacterium]|jgi:biopolymer transport protein ExbD|nr:biopolymer transporter ExbD [Burkholderiales bacterium]MBP7519929.1 biopolymer transporter ExbD [Leptothrix sp. (in: b-proteobacteria)]HQY07469.1 biopolymer transporter ExbD [Burkholderiaceae bacterium]
MAMFQTPAASEEEEVLSTINTTPLVDVMLVLLIIFLITIPVVNYSIQVQLPKERLEVRESRPENIVISVDAAGAMYWFDSRVASAEQLRERLLQVSRQQPQPEVHVRADAGARYEPVGRLVDACQRAGIARVSFITEPPARH